jgi:hypothetical protein
MWKCFLVMLGFLWESAFCGHRDHAQDAIDAEDSKRGDL